MNNKKRTINPVQTIRQITKERENSEGKKHEIERQLCFLLILRNPQIKIRLRN